MYVVLLVLGALTTASGLALVATGVSAGAESEITTPGTIATIGGLVLIGLGLVVRELQRIEHALAARPMPRAARPAEASVAAVPAATADRTAPPARPPLPPIPKAEPHPQSAPTPPAAAPATEDAAIERLREKFPTLVRLENAPAVEETDASLAPQPRVEEVVGAVKNGHDAAAANGATPPRAVPSVDGRPRKSGPSERQKGSVFEAFWPSGQRRRSIQTASAPVVAPGSAAVSASVTTALPALANGVPGAGPPLESEPAASEPVAAAVEASASEPVSILKSGVVEGMAYALYSDGSIEAQLPQGRLRFGSITELRNHIENAS